MCRIHHVICCLSVICLTGIPPAAAQNTIVITESQSDELKRHAQEVAEAETAAEAAAREAEEKRKKLEELQSAFGVTRPTTSEEILRSFSSQIDIYDGRAYTKRRDKTKPRDEAVKFPWQLKCSSVDFRTIHGCLELRFFDPSARVYFDTGVDDPGEIDIFNDGNLNITVDLVSIYWPWRLGRSEFFDQWSWGPVVGAGIGSSANDSEDGSKQSSNAPVVLLSAGGMLEYKLESGTAFAFETGYSTGFSTDESFGDANDTALFVGLRINVPLGEKKPPKASAQTQ